jgi:hypothetical protein
MRTKVLSECNEYKELNVDTFKKILLFWDLNRMYNIFNIQVNSMHDQIDIKTRISKLLDSLIHNIYQDYTPDIKLLQILINQDKELSHITCKEYALHEIRSNITSYSGILLNYT